MLRMNNYSNLVHNISTLLEQARNKIVQAVDSFLVRTYWHIGRQIVEFEQQGNKRAGYGQELLKRLSDDLSKQFGAGFSIDNLERMRKFYITWPVLSCESEKSATVLRKSINLSWSHYLRLMTIKDPSERSFYEIEAVENKRMIL